MSKDNDGKNCVFWSMNDRYWSPLKKLIRFNSSVKAIIEVKLSRSYPYSWPKSRFTESSHMSLSFGPYNKYNLYLP